MKQLNFRHFNTRSKNFTVTVIFPQNKTKTAPKRPIRTYTSPKMHLACPPKFCICIVFNFSRDGCNTKEKWKPTVTQFFLGGGGGGGKQGVLWDMSKWQILLCLVYQGVFGHFMPTIPITSEDFRRLPKMSEEPSKHLTEFSLETLSPTQTFKTQL